MMLLLVCILALIAFSVAGGLILWWPTRGDVEARASLGQSLLTGVGVGAVISLVFFFLNDETQKHQTQIANRQSKVQQETSARQTLRLTLSLQRDLTGVDLNHKDLRSFDLARKTLSFANFDGARLAGARMVGASLYQSSFIAASLVGANLSAADARGALFAGADLHRAMLSSALLDDARFGTDDRGHVADLSSAILIDAHLRNSCLARANLRGALLGGADLTDAVLTNADLRGAKLERDGIPVNFTGASLAGAKFDPGSAVITRALAQQPPVSHFTPPRAPAQAARDVVTGVSDGDTIELRHRGWVQIIGIDAANLDKPFGKEAQTYLQKLFAREPVVRYVLGPTPRELRPGGTGRWLAYVWLQDGGFLNGTMLRDGYAVRKSAWPEGRTYPPAMNAAESLARAQGLRLWTTCPSQP
jgi:uncharacterized protein YjbI with pentapeptide repeats